jgi:myo-inositol 2-dehydrogenase/D-chiro-inositol 1-dehydrogenase
LIGAGRIGRIHADNLVQHPRVEGIVVHDAVPDMAAELAQAHGADVAESTDSLIAAVDAVLIATPAPTHVGLVETCVRTGTPALCEKPLAMRLSEADRAVQIVEASSVPVQVGFNRRWDHGYRTARDRVASGAMGAVTLVVGQHHDHQVSSPDYIRTSGGEFKDQLIHDIDILRFVTGQDVVQVHAAGTATGFPWFTDLDDFAHTATTLWLDGGALAVLVGSRHDPVGYDVRMEVFGTEDSIAVGLDPRTPIRSVERNGFAPTDPYTEWVPRFGDTYAAELDAFIRLAAGEGPNECTVRDGRDALRIAEACGLSAREGRIVSLEEVS